MNTAFFDYCVKSLKRRKKQVLKAATAIFLSFTFVAGVLLFKSNIYEWQMQSAKHRYGDWFVIHILMSQEKQVSQTINMIITGIRQILMLDIWMMTLSVLVI